MTRPRRSARMAAAVLGAVLTTTLAGCGESPPPRSTPDKAQRCVSDPRLDDGLTARAQVLCLGTAARVEVAGTRTSDTGALDLTITSIGPAPDGALTPELLGSRAAGLDLDSLRMVYVRGEFTAQSSADVITLDSYSPFDLTIGLRTVRGTQQRFIGRPPGCLPARVGAAPAGTAIEGCSWFVVDRDDRAVAATFDYVTAGTPGTFAPDDALRWTRRL